MLIHWLVCCVFGCCSTRHVDYGLQVSRCYVDAYDQLEDTEDSCCHDVVDNADSIDDVVAINDHNNGSIWQDDHLERR